MRVRRTAYRQLQIISKEPALKLIGKSTEQTVVNLHPTNETTKLNK
jgi:hypothetical protein